MAHRAAPAPSWVPLTFGATFGVVFFALAWAPHDRADWLLENLISAPVAVALVLSRRRLRLGTFAWGCVFLFLAFHEVGSHHTYSRVPWMEWSRTLLDWAPAWERNHYDRFVHLAFGLLVTPALTELFAAPLATSPWLRRTMPTLCILAFSSGYELIEWAAARIADPELGIAFVGAQGDVWDAQKDMALALGGSVASSCGLWIRDIRRAGRDSSGNDIDGRTGWKSTG